MLEATNGAHAEIEAYKRERDGKIKLQDSFPLEVFPEWLQSYAKEVSAACELPVSVIGFGIMGMLSCCYGMHLQIGIKNRYVPYCHDWFVMIAKVSLGKSPVFSYLQPPIRQIQSVLRGQVLEGEDEQKVRTVINDASPEAMNKAQGENGGAVAHVTGETPLLTQMSNTQRAIPLQPYLSGHTGEGYEMLRITRETKDVERARLAIYAATQEAGLREIHNRPEIQAKGIVARCTFYVAPAITEDDLRDDDPEVSEALSLQYEETLRELGIRYRSNETAALRFDHEAGEARRKWRNRFKRLHRLEGSRFHEISDHCSKLEDKVCRWAGLLHVLWCEERKQDPGAVSLKDWGRALSLLGFDLYHYKKALGVIQEGPADALAKRLQSWIKPRRGQLIRLREVKRHVTAFAHATEEVQRAAVQVLVDRDLVRFEPNTNPGRTPSPAIEVL